MSCKMSGKHSVLLPDLLEPADGARIRTPAQWMSQRQQLLGALVALQYGGLPEATRARHEVLHVATSRQFAGAQVLSLRIFPAPPSPFSFALRLTVPAADGPVPVVLTGDACWTYATDAVVAEVLRRGFVLAQFNRAELAADAGHGRRDNGIYTVLGGSTFGAIAAWAWGYHRCVDVLSGLPMLDPQRIAITGHSRGGKASLLAGATDGRIALTHANNSGAAGAGCYRDQGPGAETLADLLRDFGHWLGPGMGAYAGREAQLPFDQHTLKALVAPRLLLTTEARQDLWANPQGTWTTHLAAREVYALLGVPDHIACVLRDGDHQHSWADWCSFLDVADTMPGRAPSAVAN